MQKKLTFVLILACFILVNSCNSDTDSKLLARVSVTYVDPSQTPNYDQWVVATNTQGHVLDFVHVTQTGSVDLKGPAGADNITITRCTFIKMPVPGSTVIRQFCGFQSMQGIPAGTIMEDPVQTYVPPPSEKGTVSLTLTNYSPGPTNKIVFTVSPGYNQLFDFTPVGGVVSLNVKLLAIPSEILGAGLRNNVPVYHWLHDVKPGDNLTVSLNDFSPSKIIPGSNAFSVNVRGCPVAGSDQGYYMPGGYIDGFDHYVTDGFAFDKISGEQISYIKKGAIPNSMTIPPHTFSKTPGLSSIKDFSFQFSLPYTYQAVIFFGDSDDLTQRLSWNAYAPAGEKIIFPDLPIQIWYQYPNMNLSLLKGAGVNVVQRLDGGTYVDAMITPLYQQTTFESFTYAF